MLHRLNAGVPVRESVKLPGDGPHGFGVGGDDDRLIDLDRRRPMRERGRADYQSEEPQQLFHLYLPVCG